MKELFSFHYWKNDYAGNCVPCKRYKMLSFEVSVHFELKYSIICFLKSFLFCTSVIVNSYSFQALHARQNSVLFILKGSWWHIWILFGYRYDDITLLLYYRTMHSFQNARPLPPLLKRNTKRKVAWRFLSNIRGILHVPLIAFNVAYMWEWLE